MFAYYAKYTLYKNKSLQKKNAITKKILMQGVANYSDCLFWNDIVRKCLCSSDKEKTTM